MRRLIQRLYDTSRYESLVDKDRARMVYAMGTIIFILLMIYMTFSRNATTGFNLWQSLLAGTNSTLGLYVLVILGAVVGSIVLTRTGRLQWGSGILVICFVIPISIPAAQSGMYTLIGTISLVVIILMSGLLLGIRGLIGGTLLAAVLVIWGLSVRPNVAPPVPATTASDALNYAAGFTIISSFTFLFLRFLTLSRSEAAAGAREDRLRLAELTTQVSQRISRRMALSEVLNNAVEQIETSYPSIYHAQIFLVDDMRQNARLVASTGEVGRLLLGRKHSLAVGSLSVIGQVTVQGKPIIARSNAGDGVHRRNEFLPETVVEAAFPLRIGDNIIGALDMQSKISNTFADDDIPLFQSLADHLAIAIDNARLFEETEKRLEENQQLVEQTRRTAADIERLNQQLTGRFWEEYLSGQSDSMGLNVDFKSKAQRKDEEWTSTLEDAVSYNHPIQQSQDGMQVIAVPVRVRGQVIGAMEFELDETGNLSPEDLNLIEEVGEQLGLAAESNRLFETSQRVAQREALVNEISTRLQASNNVEMTLNEAARSLRSTLKANRVTIRLGTPPAAPTNGNGHTQDGEA
jgi:GAF domain-containing protein